MPQKPHPNWPRRTFLQHATAWTTLAACWMPQPSTFAAATPKTNPAEWERLLAQLEANDDRMFWVDRAESAVVHLLAHLRGAREILEIGTAHGYWTAWLALAASAKNGRVTTIEILPERRARALEHLQALGVRQRVISLEGDAHALVPGLKKTFDFIFLNADKAGNLDYWRKLHPRKLKPGGLVLTYNLTTRRDQMKDFIAEVRAHPQVTTAVFSAVPDDAFFAAVDLR